MYACRVTGPYTQLSICIRGHKSPYACSVIRGICMMCMQMQMCDGFLDLYVCMHACVTPPPWASIKGGGTGPAFTRTVVTARCDKAA